MNPFDPKAALLAKHAQHVVLVHFPIALFLTGVAFDFAARWAKKAAKQATLAAAARFNIFAAALSVLPTLATGIAAWRWQLGGHKLKGLLLLHVALGSASGLLIWAINYLTHPRPGAEDDGDAYAPWLPKVASFLAGLPECSRRRRTLVPLHGYIDDSQGGKGLRRMAVLAGFVNEAEWWAKFSDQWQEWLNVHPRLPYLKMDELNNLRSQWGADVLNRKLDGFLEIIATPPMPSMTYISLDLDTFEKWKIYAVKPLDNVFVIPALAILGSVGHEQVERGKQEQCEVIFDKQEIFAPRLQIMYPEIRASLCASNPALAVLPRQPRFEDDKEYLPLQAADMLAWIVRHVESGEAHDYEWIQRAFYSFPRCTYTGEWPEMKPMSGDDKRNMMPPEAFAEFLQRLERTKLGRRYAKHLRENYEQNRLPKRELK